MKKALLLLALLLATTGVIAAQASAADAGPAAATRLQALDQAILTAINQARVAHGLRPLTVSADLRSAAVAHSRSMLEKGFFSHDSIDGTSFVNRVKRFYRPTGYAAWSAGENLIYNTAELDAETAVKAWLQSPAHRENMLAAQWREIGIGSLHSEAAGGPFGGEPTWVITVDFGARTLAKPKPQPKPQPKP